jgi:hypothetical protein
VHFERFPSRIHPEMVKWRNLCPNAQIQELYRESPPDEERLSHELIVGAGFWPRANQNRGCSERYYFTHQSLKRSQRPPARYLLHSSQREYTHTHKYT